MSFPNPLGCDSCAHVLGADRKHPDAQACFYSSLLFCFLGIWICFEWSRAIPHLCTCRISFVPRGFIIASPPPRSSDFDVYTSKQSVWNPKLPSKLGKFCVSDFRFNHVRFLSSNQNSQSQNVFKKISQLYLLHKTK